MQVLGRLFRLLAGVLAVSLVLTVAPLLSPSGARPAVAAPAPDGVVRGEACSYDANRDDLYRWTSHLEYSVQCVAGEGRLTRGVIQEKCITEPKALEPDATYEVGECKGGKKVNNQAEAVAQARVIAQLNQEGVDDDSGPVGAITPNLQWETVVKRKLKNGVIKKGGRVDLLLYDRKKPDGNVGIGEVKGDWNETAQDASGQLNEYIDGNDGKLGDHKIVKYDFSESDIFPDTFEIVNCGDQPQGKPYWDTYVTEPVATAPGVLMVVRTRKKCEEWQKKQAGQPTSEPTSQPAAKYNPGSKPVVIGIDNNKNGNDDLFDDEIDWAEANDPAMIRWIPTAVEINFPEPLHIVLTDDEMLTLIQTQAALGQHEPVSQAGTRILQVIEDAASGNTEALLADSKITGYARAGILEIEAMLKAEAESPKLVLTGRYVSALESGGPVSSTVQAQGAEELADEIGTLTGEDPPVDEMTAAFQEMTDGSGVVSAAEDVGLSDLDEQFLIAAFAADIDVDGALAFGAVAAGPGILLLFGIVALADILVASHWNMWGDPHIVTLDGLTYDMQSVGEFHLLEVPGDDVDIQGRFTAINNTVSHVTDLAFAMDDTYVQVSADGTVLLNGDPMADDQTVTSFGDGSLILRQGAHVSVLLADGITITFGGDDLAVTVPDGVRTAGLLGNHNGVSGDDLQYPDGTPVASADPATLDGGYADAWRLTDADSMFWYGDDESTATFTNRDYPSDVVTLGHFDAAVVNAAAQQCISQGVVPGPQFDACELDVAETGDASYAAAAAVVTGFLVAPGSATVDASGTLSEDYDGAIPVNLKPNSVWNPTADPASGTAGSQAAGPILDSGGYTFSVPSLPAHDSTTVSFELDVVGLDAGNADSQSVTVQLDSLPAAALSITPGAATVSAGPVTVDPIGTGQTSSGSPYQRYQVTITGADTASQLRFQLSSSGFKGVLGTSLALDNLNIALHLVPPQDYPYTLGDQIQAGQVGTQAADGAGDLETTVSADQYHFQMPADDDGLYLAWTSCPAGTTWQLLAADGSVEAHGGCGNQEIRGPRDAAYTLVVSASPGTQAPATYSTRLIGIPPDAAATLSIDGPAVTLSTTTPGQNGSVTFDATAGQQISLRASGSTLPGSTTGWTLISPDGVTVFSEDAFYGPNGVMDRTTLPSTGTYTVKVDPQGASTGSVTFQGWTVPADATVPMSIDGPAVTLSTTTPGQNGWFTFDATAGQQILLHASGSTFPGSTTGWTLVSPTGATVFSEDGFYGPNGVMDRTALPASGTYTVEVDPSGASTGSVTFQGWTVPADATVPMSIDGPAVTLTTTTPGQNASLTFNATAGQQIQLQASGSTFPGSTTGWTLISPDGATVFSEDAFYGPNGVMDRTILPDTGTYTVKVDPAGSSTGSVTFQGWTVPAADVVGTMSIDGPPTTMTIGTGGQNGWLYFDATAGQQVLLRASGSTFPGSTTGWTLISPDGVTVFSEDAFYGPNGVMDRTTLPATGTYRIKVDPSGSSTGSVTFQGWTVPADATVPMSIDGPAVTLTTTTPGQNGAVTFNGTAGQQILLQASGSTFPASTTGWTLVSPTGATVFSEDGFYGPNGVMDRTTLPATGTYTVKIDPSGSSTGSVTFQAWTVPADATLPMSIDGPAVTLTISSRGQNGSLTFNATAGQTIKLQASGSTFPLSTTGWTLVSPTGAILFTEDAFFGPNALMAQTTLPASGTYTVKVNPQGTSTGSVTFQAQSVQTNLCQQCSDTMTTTQELTRGMSLHSANGQYTLTLQSSDGNFVLYGPNGQALWASGRAADYVILQSDGNLVGYTSAGAATWATGTNGTGANRLVLQNDGNLVLYSATSTVWATGT